MTRLSFSEQIKHPNWQKRRLQIMEQASFQCERCGTGEVTLNVHHKRYVKGRMYWDYEDHELACLCEDCHKKEHAHRDLLEKVLLQAEEQGVGIESVVALVVGYLEGEVLIDPVFGNDPSLTDGNSYHLGILASIAGCAEWRQLRAAAEILKPKTLSPAQESAFQMWGGK